LTQPEEVSDPRARERVHLWQRVVGAVAGWWIAWFLALIALPYALLAGPIDQGGGLAAIPVLALMGLGSIVGFVRGSNIWKRWRSSRRGWRSSPPSAP